MTLSRVVSSANVVQGVRAVGANTVVRIGSSVVSGNGLGTDASGGAQLLSYGNNQINGNTTDGPNPTIIPLR